MKKLAFEIIGGILIIRESAEEKVLRYFAENKIKSHNHIKTVLLQTSRVHGQTRTRKLEYFLGDKNLETVHKEHGSKFILNPMHTFFSPRLSYERQRIANLVREKEQILNFFSGVGPFSIAIARKQKMNKIHSIEINEKSYEYMEKNIALNKCENSVITYFGDAYKIVPKKFLNSVNRVLLPLPLESDRSLPLAVRSLKNGKGVIHWQITKHMESRKLNMIELNKKIQDLFDTGDISEEYEIISNRIIRWLSPGIAHIAVDIELRK